MVYVAGKRFPLKNAVFQRQIAACGAVFRNQTEIQEYNTTEEASEEVSTSFRTTGKAFTAVSIFTS